MGGKEDRLFRAAGAAGSLMIIGAVGYLGSYVALAFYPGSLLAQLAGAFIFIHAFFRASIFRQEEFAYPGKVASCPFVFGWLPAAVVLDWRIALA